MDVTRTRHQPIWTVQRGAITVTRLDGHDTTWHLELATEHRTEVVDLTINRWQRDLLAAALDAPAEGRCAGCDARDRRVEWFHHHNRQLMDLLWRPRRRRVLPTMFSRPQEPTTDA